MRDFCCTTNNLE